MSKMILAAALFVCVGSAAFANESRLNVPKCSTAGDQVLRPILKVVNGKLVVVGYECVQDQGGGNNGG